MVHKVKKDEYKFSDQLQIGRFSEVEDDKFRTSLKQTRKYLKPPLETTRKKWAEPDNLY